MSELKVYHCNEWHNEYTEFYMKSEVDKVIVELKAQKAQAEDDCAYWKTQARKNAVDNVVMAKQRAEALKRERRRKNKQCVAMAEWCNSEMGREAFACFRPRGTKELWREGHNYWAKWRKIWFELAQKFKESV